MPILTSSGVPKILQNRILGNILACFRLSWKVLGLSWKPLELPLEWRRGFMLFSPGMLETCIEKDIQFEALQNGWKF